MFFLNICGGLSKIQPIWRLVGIIVNIIMIGIPILLIIFGMVDLGKAVIASKEEEVKKATKLLGKRFLYAVGVFAMVWVVTFLLSVVSGTMVDDDSKVYDEAAWKKCWKCNIRGNGKEKGSICYGEDEILQLAYADENETKNVQNIANTTGLSKEDIKKVLDEHNIKHN